METAHQLLFCSCRAHILKQRSTLLRAHRRCAADLLLREPE